MQHSKSCQIGNFYICVKIYLRYRFARSPKNEYNEFEIFWRHPNATFDFKIERNHIDHSEDDDE